MVVPAIASNIGRRERFLLLISLLAFSGLAWTYLVIDAQRMNAAMAISSGDVKIAAMASPWEPASLFMTFAMWAVMMVGMMLPSAAPAITLYATMVRRNREIGTTLPSAWLFTAGYLLVWAGFSVAASVLQASLQEIQMLSPMMISTSVTLSSAILIIAGIYQWLPFKRACLEKCRTPLQFFLMRWRTGGFGSIAMGAEHGVFCVGCCWALMLLLFAVGIMELFWVVLIACFVLSEKLLPENTWLGRWFSRLAGLGMVITGVAMLV